MSIEAISLFDVIEHIEYPIEFLNGLIAHFVNVKYIIITIPAEVELWTNFDVFYGHFKRYNFKSIDMDFKKCSANIIYKKKFFIKEKLIILQLKIFLGH